MSAQSCVIGTQSASVLPVNSPSLADEPQRLETVGDLLHAIAGSNTKPDGMLLTTARHLPAFHGKSIDTLPIEVLQDATSAFALYLRERRYKRNSVRTYCHNLRVLLGEARRLGWVPNNQPISDAWRPVWEAVSNTSGVTKDIVRYAISQRISPADFSDRNLAEWREWAKKRGWRHGTGMKMSSRFRKVVIDNGLQPLLPHLNCLPSKSRYGIAIEDMPDPLKSEIVALLRWKTDRFAKGRPQRARLRAVSAAQLQVTFGQLYGFAAKIAGRTDITSLVQLVTEDVVTSFVEWGLNVRRVSPTVYKKLASLFAAIRHHPRYNKLDWKWFSDLFLSLPEESESDGQRRKSEKMLPYDILLTVPESIRAERLSKKFSEQKEAFLIHDELLVRWFTVLAWRQRNIRECRLGDPESANLFCAELPPMQYVARAAWVEEALRKNPDEGFWQFHFREHETKTGQQVRAIVPQCLVPPLENYLNNYRPKLVKNPDPGTLFVNRRGGALNDHEVTDRVAELVLEHAGRRVTPHLFRSIFAYKWLEEFPEDFLTLSKILWHRDLNTTLKIYGANFNESNGAKRIDEWFQLRINRAANSELVADRSARLHL